MQIPLNTLRMATRHYNPAHGYEHPQSPSHHLSPLFALPKFHDQRLPKAMGHGLHAVRFVGQEDEGIAFPKVVRMKVLIAFLTK